jgi:hypothetical protein
MACIKELRIADPLALRACLPLHIFESPMSRQLISSGSTFDQEIGYSRAVVDGDWVFV